MTAVTYHLDPDKLAATRKQIYRNVFISAVLIGIFSYQHNPMGVYVVSGFVVLCLVGLGYSYYLYSLCEHYLELNPKGIRCTTTEFKLIAWSEIQNVALLKRGSKVFLLIYLHDVSGYLSAMTRYKRIVTRFAIKRCKGAVFCENLSLYRESPEDILTNCRHFLN